jgi:hypothetical protein
MEEREFKIWATSVKGWLQAEANTQWQRYLRDSMCKKDTDGLNGAQRCWILKEEVEWSNEVTYVDARVSQSSKEIKNPTNKDIAGLEAHLTKVCVCNRIPTYV